MNANKPVKVKKIPGIATKYRISLLAISFIIVIFDQVTKFIVRDNLSLLQSVKINEYCDWTLAYNQGAAFSLLANQGGWQRIFFGIIATFVSVLLVFYILNKNYKTWIGIAVSFILGGAIGNLIDRIISGRVTDFIDWHIGNHHWPAFNIADSFICIGVTMIVIDSLFFKNSNK
jgi:signal peptidase II